ncbi:MAG TPA: tripartite tricarboxylate transporter substrate binding protein [Burkholderiaceae bacterium]|nr:tripartite tricarboxylate transporter substrate binding protein [Burkholderiaceae bacterium]
MTKTRFAGARRAMLAAAAALAAVAAVPSSAVAQKANWPERTIRLIVPFAPGGVTDTSGRLIADELSRRLGQQVVVENKPGASGNIGTQLGAEAPADGYTLVLAFDGTMVINPHVFAKVPFDTLKDFAPVGKIGDAVLILVAHPEVKAKTLNDVIELSKSDANGLSYGTSGTGGTPHIAGELLKQRTGARLTHIPYKGGGQAMSDLLGGNIPLVYTAVAGAHAHVKAGKLRAIAVSSAQRTDSLPEVPTFIESGVPDFVVNSWVGLLAPAKTSPEIVGRLNEALNAALKDPTVREKLGVMGIEASPGSPEAFGEQMREDLGRYAKVVEAAGIKLQ